MFNDQMVRLTVWLADVRSRISQTLIREGGQGIMEYSILLGAIAIIGAVALYAANFDFGTMTAEIQDCISFESTCG
jgi:hypothetical protein